MIKKVIRRLSYIHVSDTPENQTRRSSDETVGAIPDSNASSLFFPFPPRRCDENETRIETRLENSKEKASRGKGVEAGSGTGGSKHCAYEVRGETQKVIPHRTKLTVIYFPVGKRCMRTLVGY
jgi:hypothetical protein